MKTFRHILQWLALVVAATIALAAGLATVVGVESAVEVVHCARGMT
jgi:hypothetical protein